MLITGLVLVPVFAFAQIGDVNPNPTSSCVSITHNLSYRSRDVATGGDVSTLQDFLESQGYLHSDPTGYFGLQTQAAVQAFQSAQNILNSGYVGPVTRAAINTSSCGTATTPVAATSTTPTTPVIPSGWNPCPMGASFNSVTGAPCVSTNQTQTLITSISPTSGPIGTQVTIYGSGLSSSDTINFSENGQLKESFYGSKTIQSATSNQITFAIPLLAIENFPPGVYQVTVSNGNGMSEQLGQSNAVSFTMTGNTVSGCLNGAEFDSSTGAPCSNNQNQPSITVLSPNGGEQLTQGQTYNITWQENGLSTVNISLINTSNPQFNYTIANNLTASSDSYSWTIPSEIGPVIPGSSYKIWITGSTGVAGQEIVSDNSQSTFTITSPNSIATRTGMIESATLDQNSMTESSGNFSVTGSAVAHSITVELISTSYSGSTDSNSTSQYLKDGSIYQAVEGSDGANSDILSNGGRWSVNFNGVPAGTYHVYVYSGDAYSIWPLTTGTLTVSGNTTQTSATILTSTQVTNLTPYIIGTASGVSQINVALVGQYGDLVYQSGPIAVLSNGSWSVTVSPALALGQYTINVYDANHNQLTSKPLTIIGPMN